MALRITTTRTERRLRILPPLNDMNVDIESQKFEPAQQQVITAAFDTPLRHDWDRFLRVAEESLAVSQRHQLHEWLQGDFKYFLPHDIFVAVWGNGDLAPVTYEVLSKPGLETDGLSGMELLPLARELYQRWLTYGKLPYELSNPPVHIGSRPNGDSNLVRVLRSIRSVLVHGITDERNRRDCLYIALHSHTDVPLRSRKMLEILLPYVDAALRRVTPLTVESPAAINTHAAPNSSLTVGLSARELEIMEWVRKGKTNQEIALILQISLFTVKNHLQRIFRKLDVLNRAQAVGKFNGEHSDNASTLSQP